MRDGPESFAVALTRETLRTERLRFLIVQGLLALSLVVLLPLAAFPLRAPIETLFGVRFNPLVALVALLGMMGYEALMWRLTQYYAVRFPRRLVLLRFANALEEVTFVTVGLGVAGLLVGPVAGLISPPFLLYFLLILLAILRLDVRVALLTGLMAALQYLALAAYVLGRYEGPGDGPFFLYSPLFHLERAIFLAVAGGLAALVTHQIRSRVGKSLQSIEERNRLVRLFGQHVSPAVVQRLLDQPATVQSEARFVCILFLDIRNFTQFSQDRPPAETFAYLNRLFGGMVDIVNAHHGIINKFLGDGFMAIFGAPLADPDPCANAVAAAEAILAHLARLNEGGQIPLTRIGMGLHAGEAVVGTLGSAQRQEYTVVGDVVNIASRLESLNKEFGSQVLVSATVWEALPPTARNGGAGLGLVPVRGHQAPVEVYRLA